MNEHIDWREIEARAQAYATTEEAVRVKRGEENAIYEKDATLRTSLVLQEIMLTCQAIASIFNDAVTDARIQLRVLEESGKRPLLYSFVVRRGDDCHEVQVRLNGCDEIWINLDLGFYQRSGKTLKYHVNDRAQLNSDYGTKIFSAGEVAKQICEQLIKAPHAPLAHEV